MHDKNSLVCKGGKQMNEVVKGSKKTPIEIMLQVDSGGKTTAKALYEFLELDKSNYSRWCKKNILENSFAEENIDFWAFVINDEWGGQATTDYKLTASFAKKLAMSSQTERGEQAREYFLKVEQRLKQTVIKDDEKQTKLELQKMRAEAMKLNAQTRAFNSLMKSVDKKHLSPIAVEVFGLKALESTFGVNVNRYLPETEKTYNATEVGKMLGITANRVGRIANEHNLKTAEYGVFKLDKSKSSDKEMENFFYNQKGIEKIRQIYEETKNKTEEKAAK